MILSSLRLGNSTLLTKFTSLTGVALVCVLVALGGVGGQVKREEVNFRFLRRLVLHRSVVVPLHRATTADEVIIMAA
jgi:hypothetical protein